MTEPGELLDPNWADFCDNCGPSTRAYLWAEMPDGKELSYCGSCGKRFRRGLLLSGAKVLDLSYAILP